jgi:D-amino-acid dehydrogenase
MTKATFDNATVILGAGIIGLACAHYLKAAGQKILILDKQSVGRGCSYRNCGHILPSHILPLNSPSALKAGLSSLFDTTSTLRIKPQLNWDFIKWMIKFSQHCSARHILSAAHNLKPLLDVSMAEYEQLVADNIFECEWQKTGLLYLFKTPKALDKFHTTNQFLQKHFGLTADFIPPQALRDKDPSLNQDLAGGFLYNNDAHLMPEMLLTNWANYLKQHGVQFIENCEVLKFERTHNMITKLITTSGPLNVDKLVIAAGAFSKKLGSLLGCNIPIVPGKGYSITMAKPENSPLRPIVLPEKNIALTPFQKRLRIGSIMEFVDFDASISNHRIQQLEQSTAEYLNTQCQNPEIKKWFGWRPMTYDSLPIIGKLPNYNNAYIATGHGMMGTMLAPATGRMIAEIITGKKCTIPETPYSPTRF